MILIDTNVVSEFMRSTPAPAVLDWFATQEAAQLFLSTVSEAELRAGAAYLPRRAVDRGGRLPDRRHRPRRGRCTGDAERRPLPGMRGRDHRSVEKLTAVNSRRPGMSGD
jgi:predicted nucleic acid-binding protein